MKQSPIANIIVLRIAIVALLLLPAGLLAAQNKDSEAISKLLTQVKSHAAQTSDDIATLESFTRSDLHPTAHGLQLNQIREHANYLLRDASALKEMRGEGSPWQQEAIDRIDPLLPLIAAHVTATIEHFNENRDRLDMRAFRDYVVANQRMIEKAHSLISDLVDYSEARARADELEQKLEMVPPAESGS